MSRQYHLKYTILPLLLHSYIQDLVPAASHHSVSLALDITSHHYTCLSLLGLNKVFEYFGQDLFNLDYSRLLSDFMNEFADSPDLIFVTASTHRETLEFGF